MTGPDVPAPCEVCFVEAARPTASTCSDKCEAELVQLMDDYEGGSLPPAGQGVDVQHWRCGRAHDRALPCPAESQR